MDKLHAYLAAADLAIKSLDAVFMRLNSAESIRPLIPLSQRLALPPAQRYAAERAEIASYDVAPEHWGARLCLMSAWESLQAARRIAASAAPGAVLDRANWADAKSTALESARLAKCAARVFYEAARR